MARADGDGSSLSCIWSCWGANTGLAEPALQLSADKRSFCSLIFCKIITAGQAHTADKNSAQEASCRALCDSPQTPVDTFILLFADFGVLCWNGYVEESKAENDQCSRSLCSNIPLLDGIRPNGLLAQCLATWCSGNCGAGICYSITLNPSGAWLSTAWMFPEPGMVSLYFISLRTVHLSWAHL